MEFEVVEFYPAITKEGEFIKDEKNNILGSLHIYFTEWGVDLRGIRVRVKKKGNYVRFHLPANVSFDFEDKIDVRYPVFSFMDPDKKKLFIDKLQEIAKPYVLKTLEENPLFLRKRRDQAYKEKSRNKQNKNLFIKKRF